MKRKKNSKVNYSKLAIKMIKEIISMVNCLWSITINISINSFSHLISLEKRVPFDSYMELLKISSMGRRMSVYQRNIKLKTNGKGR